ncbi:hypothetical protein ACFCX4_11310 [Kitasatospora sp. NPDC056327]|uniref:hypothetical protein n=1 Tax=Kitasatospora sp. NPDC056327 TaxID=3345785 RepID=UPI0035DA5505
MTPPVPNPLGLAPHRLVREDGRTVAHARAEPGHPVLPGHYPGFAVLPAVCLVDCAHRAVAADLHPDGPVPELAAVERCRLRRPVLPGDDLTLTLAHRHGPDGEVRTDVTVTTARGRCADLRLVHRPAPAGAVTAAGAGSGDSTGTTGATSAGGTSTGAADGPAGRPPVADTVAVAGIIPHRYPILLVDRVTRLDPDRTLTAVKAVTANEPCYAGLTEDHGPHRYHYPRPLLAESWAQAAVLLACWNTPNPDVTTGKVELAGAFDDIAFHRPVTPGDLLEHHVRVVRAVGDSTILAGGTRVAGRPVADFGHFIVTLRPLADLLAPAAPAARPVKE